MGATPDFPVQLEKVQPPALRDETLARDRLLEWLGLKIHGRVVLVTAEAGYGKTTLLADFSRRSRLRTLWYRLDRGDRDWIGFMAHLAAAFRIHHPGFAPATDRLLRESGTTPPTREHVLDTFLRELGELPPEPSALVFDDFHAVDDAADIRQIVNELLARAPERLAFVFASRQAPPLRLARLRALGEVAELRTAELRFSADETEQLFRDAYAIKLEPRLLAELSRRTEGWAASLQLVRTALHDRDAAGIRAFVRSLSGAEGHLYDYLAEEVVGDLPPELQDFLMRTSILDTVDLTLGPVAAGTSVDDTKRLMDDARRLGLLGRIGPDARYEARAHPLVRDFLRSRLEKSLGVVGARRLHLEVAAAASNRDWQLSARHYLAAGNPEEAATVVRNALSAVLAAGAFHAAADLLQQSVNEALSTLAGLVVASRLAQQGGDAGRAIDLAERALALDPGSPAAITTLMAARTFAGDASGAMDLTRRLEVAPGLASLPVANAYRASLQSSLDGSLDVALRELDALERSVPEDSARYRGVNFANLSQVWKAMGGVDKALETAEAAIGFLTGTSGDLEAVSAHLARASALAHQGHLAAAREETSQARELAPEGQAVEVAAEVAELEFYYGDASRAEEILARYPGLEGEARDQAVLVRSALHARAGRVDLAREDLDTVTPGVLRTTVAFESRRLATRALVAVTAHDPSAPQLAREADEFARKQGALHWARYARVLHAASDLDRNPSRVIAETAAEDAAAISMAAEAVTSRFGELDEPTAGIVQLEAEKRPERWRRPLRTAAASPLRETRIAAASLLCTIGLPDDVALLADIGRSHRDARVIGMSRDLARRLAPKVFVEDLGRIRIRVGDRLLDGSSVRHKVLALLCFLLTRPHFSASRENVTENLWPNLEPDDAVNSLNQTVYYLRRVFEPGYRDATTAGYVHQDGETIWLDQDLIAARSDACRQVIRGLHDRPGLADARRVIELYQGPFALDFMYDDWASAHRDPLHASVLRVLEHTIRDAVDGNELPTGIAIAERAAELEPESEELQLALVHFYRLTGAHAAAAEQYEHYASSMRDLGLEPQPLTELRLQPKR